ncbi:hypothetical protein NBRC3279_2613 [Acetobacter pasteurianus NBRC 3279]|nr:hypothetical protein NBRC3279_2613 [Acetobacter pasteurianus NBRC 3279]GCD73443.1 hypothetical protein NBRC3284_2599 [Acetobacter pasteurianus NBRC 3284]
MTRRVISERTYIARSPLFWSEYTLPRLCDIGLQQGRRQAHVEGGRLGFDLTAHGLETGQVIPGQIDGRDEILGRFVTVQRGHGPIFWSISFRRLRSGLDKPLPADHGSAEAILPPWPVPQGSDQRDPDAHLAVVRLPRRAGW